MPCLVVGSEVTEGAASWDMWLPSRLSPWRGSTAREWKGDGQTVPLSLSPLQATWNGYGARPG